MERNWEELKQEYLNGNSITKIRKRHKICETRLSEFLKKEGIFRGNTQNERGTDQTIFEKIDTVEKAYWLGFLYADGAIHSKKNIIAITLKPSDINHLKKFKTLVKANNKILLDDISCEYAFSSKKVKQDLIDKGCFCKKSLILKFPTKEQVPDEFVIDFIRGYFDGDGSLTYKKQFNQLNHVKTVIGYKPTISILGTESMLNGIQSYFNTNKKIYHKKGTHENVKILIYEGKNAINFLKKIYYKDCNTYLDRKMKRYQLFQKFNYAVPVEKSQELLSGNYR